MIEEFERHLRGTNLSENTVTSYLFAVRQFGERHEAVTKRNLKEHKAWLIEQYKPKTVNLCIHRREFAICTDFFRHFAGDFLPPCRDSLPPRQFS